MLVQSQGPPAGSCSSADADYDANDNVNDVPNLLDNEENDSLCGPASDSLKVLVEQQSTELCEGQLLTSKLKKVQRTSNLTLHTPMVNPEIWVAPYNI